jgi:hypothetical protein
VIGRYYGCKHEQRSRDKAFHLPSVDQIGRSPAAKERQCFPCSLQVILCYTFGLMTAKKLTLSISLLKKGKNALFLVE